MRIVVLALLAVTPGCKSAEREKAPPPPALDATPTPRRTVVDGAPEPRRTGDLPPDLEGLAEMPELTAEATDAEVNRRVDRVLDAFTAFVDLLGEHRDCEAMGRAMSRFADAHQQFFSSLERLNRPELQRQLAERITARGTEWVTRMTENLQRCMSNQAVMEALQKLSARPAQQATGP